MPPDPPPISQLGRRKGRTGDHRAGPAGGALRLWSPRARSGFLHKATESLLERLDDRDGERERGKETEGDRWRETERDGNRRETERRRETAMGRDRGKRRAEEGRGGQSRPPQPDFFPSPASRYLSVIMKVQVKNNSTYH